MRRWLVLLHSKHCKCAATIIQEINNACSVVAVFFQCLGVSDIAMLELFPEHQNQHCSKTVIKTEQSCSSDVIVQACVHVVPRTSYLMLLQGNNFLTCEGYCSQDQGFMSHFPVSFMLLLG